MINKIILKADDGVVRFAGDDAEYIALLRGMGCLGDGCEITTVFLNMLSAYEIKFFTDAFNTNGCDICDKINSYDAINKLYTEGRAEDIYVYLKSKYISFGLQFPEFLGVLRQHTPSFMGFISEFLLDFADVIFEGASLEGVQ